MLTDKGFTSNSNLSDFNYVANGCSAKGGRFVMVFPKIVLTFAESLPHVIAVVVGGHSFGVAAIFVQ